MRKKLKVSLTVVILVGRDAKSLWWRLWWGLAESAFGGSLESGGRFCVGEFGENRASVAVNVFIFSHLRGQSSAGDIPFVQKRLEVNFCECQNYYARRTLPNLKVLVFNQ
jgi:hypothetical protein